MRLDPPQRAEPTETDRLELKPSQPPGSPGWKPAPYLIFGRWRWDPFRERESYLADNHPGLASLLFGLVSASIMGFPIGWLAFDGWLPTMVLVVLVATTSAVVFYRGITEDQPVQIPAHDRDPLWVRALHWVQNGTFLTVLISSSRTIEYTAFAACVVAGAILVMWALAGPGLRAQKERSKTS